MRPPLRLRLPRITLRRPVQRDEPVLRGNMHRVLVLKPPGDMFQQAVFILRDDYFKTPGLSRNELLRQARSAAEEYMQRNCPNPARGVFPSPLSVFILGAACAVFALRLAGLI